MNKKEIISLLGIIFSVFFIGMMFFSNLNTEIKVNLQGKSPSIIKVPAMFTLPETIILLILTAVATACIIYFASDLSKKINISQNQGLALKVLDGDSKRLYHHLLEKGEALQKDLVYELSFSKAKTTRILDKLVQKNLVERISYGNTNKIRIIE